MSVRSTGAVSLGRKRANMPKPQDKPFAIPKLLVWEAWRRGKADHQALAACRQRCWKYDWMIDLDVQKFFDTVRWDLVVKAVEAVTDCRWVLLYVKRWLAAPLARPDGALEQRSKGTPQGSAV